MEPTRTETLAVLVLAALVAGMLIGPYLAASLPESVARALGLPQPTTLTVTSEVVKPFTVTVTQGPGHVATVRRTIVSTVTKWVTTTVTSQAAPKTTTVTRTMTATRTVTETVTRTVTRVATTTVTETVTRTVTVTAAAQPTATATAAPPQPAAGGQAPPYYEEPPPPRLPAAPAAVVGDAKLYVGDGVFAVRRKGYSGFDTLVYSVYTPSGERRLVLTAPGLRPQGAAALEAFYANVSRSGVLEAWSLQRLVEALGPGSYRLVIYGGGGSAWECKMTVTQGAVEVADCVQTVYVSSPPPLAGTYDSILSAIVLGVNETSVSAVGRAVYGGVVPGGPEAAWRALNWTDRNLVYDWVKYQLISEGGGAGVESPLEVLRTRRGVCSDYAVFTVAATLYAGLDSYVLLFPAALHAAAAVALNHTLFVLDQHLPPVELQDYLEYELPGYRGNVTLYHVHYRGGEAYVTAYSIAPVLVTDSYPADRLSPVVVEEARELAARNLTLEPRSELATVMMHGVRAEYMLYLPVVRDAAATAQRRVPLGRGYSPVFRSEWARWLSAMASTLIAKYYGGAVGRGSFWLMVRDAPEATLLEAYAVPIRGYSVEASVQGGSLVIRVTTRTPLQNPRTDILLDAYPANASQPCGVVVPPGYTSSLPYVQATRWDASGATVTIEVPLDKLQSLLRRCGPGSFLGLWLRDSLVYAWSP